nr:MAG TPA: hypothetical protein [Caudoviricetes sp.]
MLISTSSEKNKKLHYRELGEEEERTCQQY